MMSFEKALYNMVDLHGLSEKEAEEVVNYWLSASSSKNINFIRFVTGRGNHINAKGERGTLLNNFSQWLERSAFKNQVEKCTQHDGFFEVSFKQAKESAKTDFFKIQSKDFFTVTLGPIKERADNGDPYFQVLYGKLLEAGEVVPHDFKEAAKFYLKAANKNYPLAIQELARCYFHGMGIIRDDAKAVEWLKKADALDCLEATIALGDSYWLGSGVVIDDRTAISYYAKAAAHGYAEGMRKLANAYQQGTGVKKDVVASFKWYKKAADLGDVASKYNVGIMYQNGYGVEKNKSEAWRYLNEAAAEGDVEAQYWIGTCHYQGNGIKENKTEGIKWLIKAADKGSKQALHELSLIEEPEISEKYLKKSADAGHPIDKIRLLSKSGELAKMTEKQKNELISKEIKKYCNLPPGDIILLDHDSKFFLLDWMVLHEKTKYKKTALQVLEHLVEENCIFSLRRLIMLNMEGHAALQIKKDRKKAVQLMEKAIKLDDPKVMGDLAFFYEHGQGVKQSVAKAIELYQEAMSFGNPYAYYKLATLYYNGKLIEQDLNQARVLFVGAAVIENKLFKENRKAIKLYSSGLVDEYKPIAQEAKELFMKVEATIADAELSLNKLRL